MFSILSMLLLNATLRDILIVRMKGFSSSVILRILGGTLILLLVAVGHPIRTSLSVRRA